ncbi:hypothetical protein [Deinococcus aestuarii]|uniref:hypothetical protein n=1 Tax=Deinococcus aestuarii TaxID=2774531 RepID=UPI001C0C8BDA|nr:hypothetical protein [Deinococcus aestuarii]
MKSPVSLASPNLKLSREMKVLLVLLLLVALIGGGYLWLSGRSQEQALAQTPPGGDPAGSPVPGTADGQGSTPDAGLRVQQGGQVEVPSIPAFGADPAPAARPEPEPTPPPGGINPDTPLAALPTGNPFRPLELVQDPAGASGAAPSPVTAAPVTASPVTVTPTAVAPSTLAAPGRLELESVPSGEDDVAPAAEPVVIPPLPRAATPVAVASAPVSGGAFPVPTAPPAGVVTLTPPSGGRETAPTAPVPPVRPPVAGVRVPGGSPDLTALLGQRSPRGTAPAAGTGAAPATPLPTPELPQPITQLGTDAAATAAPVSPLDDLVRRRELAFDAGVLGPVNTAILRSKGGFLVVSAGQPLPDSDVVVRDVTATGATLVLGTETVLLELGNSHSTQGEP